MKKLNLIAATALVALAISGTAQAGYVYVGSWEVNQGPGWWSKPLAYTGQEAAALLFGGTAADYVISTTGSDPTMIDFNSWYSVIGAAGLNSGGFLFADNYVSPNSSQCCGLYYSGNAWRGGDPTEAASAYVADNAGSGNVNYAFELVPEPATIALIGVGMLGLAAVRRRR
jgi:hypothetical protein